MKIICQSCGAKYAIADEKVRGRRVKVRCKSCNEPIVVDGYSEPQQEEFATDEDRTRVATGAAGGGDLWSVNLSDTDQRSMTTQEVVDAWNAGQIPADAFVWREGMNDWVPLPSAPELSPYLSNPMHSAPAQPEPQPFGFAAPPQHAEAARSGGRVQGGADLFGNVAVAGSEYDVGTSGPAPDAGAQSYEDHKMTGARNENSVLFSLDALKAGVGPTASKPAARPGRPPPVEEKADLDDIMNMGGGGFANPLFGMQQNAALLSAPPPPPDPPPRPPMMSEPAAVGGSIAPASMMQPRKSNTALFAILGGVAVLAVVGILGAVLLMKGGKGEEVAKAETSEKTNGKGETAAGSTSDKQPDRPSEETKAANDTKGSATTPAASTDKKEVTEEDKKRFAEAMKKKEEEKKKEGETKPDEPAKKEEPSSGLASFNKGAAIAALGGAAAQASGCKRPGGPTGSGKAVVTFAPSGRVTSANVSGGEFPGTPVGSCVASVFRRAQVPAFSGDPVTVSKGFTISP